MDAYGNSERSNSEKYLYRLNGIVVHSGGLNGGHYVAYIRKYLKENGDDVTTKGTAEGTESKWFYFSDTHFREATEKEVQGAQAYLLVYERYKVEL